MLSACKAIRTPSRQYLTDHQSFERYQGKKIALTRDAYLSVGIPHLDGELLPTTDGKIVLFYELSADARDAAYVIPKGTVFTLGEIIRMDKGASVKKDHLLIGVTSPHSRILGHAITLRHAWYFKDPDFTPLFSPEIINSYQLQDHE